MIEIQYNLSNKNLKIMYILPFRLTVAFPTVSLQYAVIVTGTLVLQWLYCI